MYFAEIVGAPYILIFFTFEFSYLNAKVGISLPLRLSLLSLIECGQVNGVEMRGFCISSSGIISAPFLFL